MATINFDFDANFPSIIKVWGVGGGGGNAVNNMFKNGINGVDFVICNTDMQVLQRSPIANKIRLGANLTQGLGAGADPEVGKQSALESINDIKEALGHGTRMVFITAGMGGGTGTGAAPVIAQAAREMGILTVAIVTTPFTHEGEWRQSIARKGIAELQKHVDSLLVINNANLNKIAPRRVSLKDAWMLADQVLLNAAKGIAEIITVPGYVSVDFADVKTIMAHSGNAIMGMATAAGDDRALHAVEEALSSPLLENADIKGANGVLLNIMHGPDFALEELELIGEYVHKAAGPNARIITGNVEDESMEGAITVTVIATGFNQVRSETPSSLIPALQNKNQPIAQTNKVLNNSINPSNRTLGTNRAHEQTLRMQQAELFANSNNANNQPEDHFDEVAQNNQRPVENNPRVINTPAPQRNIQTFISPEERIKRLRHKDYDVHNEASLKNMEEQPAYMRRKVEIDANYAKSQHSKTTVEPSIDGKYQIKENNPYIFDNVD